MRRLTRTIRSAFGANRSDILSTSRFIFFRSTPWEASRSKVSCIIAIVWRLTSVAGTSNGLRSANALRRASSAWWRECSSPSATSRSRSFPLSSSTPDTSPNCFANASSISGSFFSRTPPTLTSNATVLPAYFGFRKSAG